MVILRNSRHSRIIPLLTIVVFLCQFTCGKVIYVGNDDQADFDKIQTGIEAADFNDTVSVAPGTYYENIILKDGIVLSGAGADVTIIDANGYGDVVDARANDAVISGFTLRNSGQFDLEHTNCGVYVDGSYAPTIKNNVIAHNRNGIGLWYGANPYISNNIIKNNNNGFYIYGSEENPSNPSIINNTIVNNQISGMTLRVMVSPVISNNIIVGHSTGINHNYVTGSPTISYNNLWHNDVNYLRDNSVDDTLAGPGSISVDPYFARPGRWINVSDPNLAAEQDDPNAVWIDGDYHLKSQAGRWDPVHENWIIDDITSPCIDAGDPNSPIGSELLPNGGVINMGAYGGTVEASKSPSETSIYTFIPEQSMVIQTGGIAGVSRTYTLTGQFRLTIDPGARKAWFSNVEAVGTDENAPDRELDPNDVFNLTALTGTIDTNGSIRFTGQTADESDVILDITSFNDSISLKGQTIPPPDSADYFIFNLDAAAQRKYGGGMGGPNDPYLIYTAEQMNAINTEPNDWDKHFKLMADIDLSGYSYYAALIAPDVDPCDPVFIGTSFTGVFNGNRHKILNLTITGESYLGLFGRLESGAEIKNLGVLDVNIIGSDYVGGIAGFNRGNITNSYCTGVIFGDQHIGSLTGRNWGNITASYTTAAVSGNEDVGGIAGGNYGSIENSYNRGAVTAERDTGGVVGANYGTIAMCYSTGTVSGTTKAGGLVGYNWPDMGIVSGFWDVETSGLPTSDGGTALNTNEMQTASTFLEAGWDFVGETVNGTEDIWWIIEGQSYPHLWWEDDSN